MDESKCNKVREQISGNSVNWRADAGKPQPAVIWRRLSRSQALNRFFRSSPMAPHMRPDRRYVL